MLGYILNHAVLRDARNWQIIFLSSFLLFGVWLLDWTEEPTSFLIIAPTAILVQIIAIKRYELPIDSLKSALITSFGLTLLFKTDQPIYLVLAAVLAIGSKFIIRFRGKHLFNPATFGIIVSIILFQNGWVSPGKWGSSVLLLLMIGAAGLMVLLKAGRIDTGLSFLFTLFILDMFRIVIYQGWEWDVLFHKYFNGSLLLFSFFMITDPATTPNHRKARIIWAAGVAILTFYLQSYVQLHTAPIWALFIVSPLTVILDLMLKSKKFEWLPTNPVKASSSVVVLSMLMIFLTISQPVSAFCGFYVAKADVKLFNKSSQVILVRNGDRSIITMNSDFDGPVRDFAMVVPVPVVLKKTDIRIVDASLFNTLDAYSGPRLVEYYDENPCYPPVMYDMVMPTSAVEKSISLKESTASGSARRNKVTIEAQYTVGEYDILILSAKESNGLRNWLIENDYKIPADANDVLEPYIKSGMKFFVVKVNLDEQKKLGFNSLRPIQISFDSPKFMLPIRLGMANANGDQDMIVYAFSKTGRVECTNYITKKIPTDRKVPLDVEGKFGKFYKAVFDRIWARHKDAVYVEYAWNVTPSFRGMKCDPCVGPPPLTADLAQAGVDWNNGMGGEQVFFTRLHIRYGRAYFPQDLQFQETPNKENFQGRYILTHPAQGDLSCIEGQRYLYELTRRRQNEVQNLAALTGWSTRPYNAYMNEYVNKIDDNQLKQDLLVPSIPSDAGDSGNDDSGKSMTNKLFTVGIGFVIIAALSLKPRRKKSII
jgi:Na+-translocating ferredoxin:NAD+ oxidoreductase RnfD subunit